MNILIEINTVLFLWPNLLMEKPHNLPAASYSWNSDRPESWQNKRGDNSSVIPSELYCSITHLLHKGWIACRSLL
ncbi:hypothetical protein F7A87_25090 [Escherichia coli O103]|nr:hypothetical protein [Escherichia coli O103]